MNLVQKVTRETREPKLTAKDTFKLTVTITKY